MERIINQNKFLLGLRTEFEKTSSASDKTYRDFGFLMGGVLVLGFAWLLFRKHEIHTVGLIVGLLFAITGLVRPQTLKKVYSVWMLLGAFLGAINSRIILGLVFFLLVTPLAFVLRLIGHDPLKLKLDKSLDSYRVETKDKPEINLSRQF